MSTEPQPIAWMVEAPDDDDCRLFWDEREARNYVAAHEFEDDVVIPLFTKFAASQAESK